LASAQLELAKAHDRIMLLQRMVNESPAQTPTQTQKRPTQMLLQKLRDAQITYQQMVETYNEMRTRLSDQHPDVVRMRKDMEMRRAEMSSLEAEIRDPDAHAQQPEQPVPCETRLAQVLSELQQAQQRIQLLEEERRNTQTLAFLQAQLDAAQQQLAELQKTHTAKHPEVVRTQRIIIELQNRLAKIKK
jgi:chromosome segregation ATPase